MVVPSAPYLAPAALLRQICHAQLESGAGERFPAGDEREPRDRVVAIDVKLARTVGCEEVEHLKSAAHKLWASAYSAA